VSTESPVVSLGADDENKARRIEFVEHPARPALLRRAIHILVEESLDAVRAQSFGKREHVFAVYVGIVAVADEDFGVAHYCFAPLSGPMLS